MTQKQSAVVATCVFLLESIMMKKDKLWRLKLTLKTQLPESFREYGVRLSLNEEPYLMRIDDLKKRLVEVNAENPLFKGDKKKQLKQIEQQIADVKTELHEAQSVLPVIEFDGTIEQLTYKDGDTIVVMMIPAKSVGELNDNRNQVNAYKIELLRD